MSLWAITSFFNPAGFQRRLVNFRIFREALGVPLVAVELSFGRPFELRPDDADIVVQLHGGDVLWQKERLLNIAVEQLPSDCRYVAWVDADVIFADPNWHADACNILERFPSAHLFRASFDLAPDYPETRDLARCEPAGHSLGFLVGGLGHQHLLTSEVYRFARRGSLRSGMAWGARADLVREHGIYDACIIGGGDRAWHAMAAGIPELVVEHCRMNSVWREHYLAWAGPLGREAGG